MNKANDLFMEAISVGKYSEAKQIFVKFLSHQDYFTFMISVSLDTQSIELYAFVCYLLANNESACMHKLAFMIMSQSLSHLNGAYSASLFHIRRAIALDPHDIKYKENILSLYVMSNTLICSYEAEVIARGILQRNASNEIALNVLARIKTKLPTKHNDQNSDSINQDNNHFMKAILTGQYSNAKSMLIDQKSRDQIVTLAFDTGSIALYTFSCFLLIENESAQIHELASSIIALALCYIEGAYSAGLYHARRAAELEPNNLNLKGYLLYFYDIPEKLLDDCEAKQIAHDILRVYPEHSIALNVLQSVQDNHNE